MPALDFSFYTWANISTYLLSGLYFSVSLTIAATIGGIALGTVIALMRLSGIKPLEYAALWYVNLLRSIPLVMVILWFFLLMPSAFYNLFPGDIGQKYRAEICALITFIIFEAAFFSEIVRAGIQSLPRGQTFAGQALGMTYAQNMRYIVLPQAMRNMLPVFLTQTIVLFQDTSLVYAIGAYDILKGFEIMGNTFGRRVETYIMAAVVYFIISFALSMLVKRLNEKIRILR
ncbi:amino acid ABC transporter permease [Methylocella sp. CPCC 101449]|jgi:glutamate/aspartate transport system permease protein|uniref:amino acid ABC transporter permease n=1 Tax=Methylocella sp. CPCC 101449 TaxID=2987531 RepID=UPI00096078BB|nr:ABC transporter permease subunit [Methylocella sp. CPCC 101449]MBN9080683.1 ABC transporter permease subunit [Hyphomicrobiales bacterium]MDT2020352.1 ABC transporter permease subunit [Methylocella sp. CPCC 101449]OJY00038.1 MAG: amino acid ABC transporter permease [Rhizobiales bacterium 62-17]HEV2574708.1 ABC transporter permease subunit [Beijerinckiaceae bacterium]